MSFKIICPHCQKQITEKDFQESEQSITHLQQFFNSQEAKYEQQLKEKLQEEWKKNQNLMITAELKKQESELNSQAQKREKQLEETIKKLEITNKTNDEMLKTKLSEKETEIIKLKQKEIDNIKEETQKREKQLNDIIHQLQLTNKTNDEMLKTKLSEKETEIIKLKQKEIDNIKEETQKREKQLEETIKKLEIVNKTNDEMLKTKLSEKETEIIKLKQKEIDNIKEETQKREKQLNEKINDLTLKLEQGRNIKSGILGSNLENDFERTMSSFYLNDDFKKTTKVINGRKPDFMLNILNPRCESETMGTILFELKNQEKLLISSVENKLAKELKERNANFGLIIWTAANAPFTRSKNYDNIFIINTDFEILILIINILKQLINKQYILTNQTKINIDDEELMEKFKKWIKDDFNKLIGKAMNEFNNFEGQIRKIGTINNDLTTIKNNLKNILIEKIETELKKFNF